MPILISHTSFLRRFCAVDILNKAALNFVMLAILDLPITMCKSTDQIWVNWSFEYLESTKSIFHYRGMWYFEM